MTSIRTQRPTTADTPSAPSTTPPDDLDRTLSSTAPDVPRGAPRLSIPSTLGWSTGIGLTLGALALRTKGAGWTAPALAAGAWKGAAVGAGIGAALLGLDRATGGEVRRQLEYVALDRRAQIGFVLRNLRHPWVGPMGLGVARDARAAQEQLYGLDEPLDGPQDAFRHAYAAALFTLRAQRDHGADQPTARRLAIGAGEAHEQDGQDNNDEYSRAMDTANNELGATLVGDGRATPGEQADDRGFVTEDALRQRVLDALRDARVTMVDRSVTPPAMRPSTAADLPRTPH
jgi:hypothetical protein